MPLLVLAASGCASHAAVPVAQSATFDPIAFFKGHTHGEGELHKLFHEPVHVSVDSIGRMAGDVLVLDQTIREAGKPPSKRRWTIKPAGPNNYTGALTEAVGPVTGEVSGPRGTISYKMRHGLTVRQQLADQSDGTTVLNRLTVRKLGLKVATLNETIRKLAR
jgi:carbon monoxide dehydrogenase subunit G